MMKQLIIARRDLNMSPGKLAAQVSHASMAFLTRAIQDAAELSKPEIGFDKPIYYCCNLFFDEELYEGWLGGSFTKIVCGARNKNKLIKAMRKADELGMVCGVDYFPIYDACRTDIQPEETDGTTLTCVGFKPMPDYIIDQIGKEYNLF